MTAELALTRPQHDLTMDVLHAEMEAAKRYVDSGLLPSGIKTPQQALTIMMVGREVGVPPTYALRNIHVIQGKPTCSAELLMALVRRAYGQAAIRVREASNEACTVEYREAGWDGVSSLTYTLDDAKRANLAGKDMWKQYPRAMLRSRAVSEAVRMAFPETIAGLYTPEEVGARVRVTASGDVELDPEESEPRLAVVEPTRAQAKPEGTLLTPDDVTRYRHIWFALVKGTSLESDAARERFCTAWTADWPTRHRTNSLGRMLSRMTTTSADEVVEHARALVEGERSSAMQAAAEELREDTDGEAFHSTRKLAQDGV